MEENPSLFMEGQPKRQQVILTCGTFHTSIFTMAIRTVVKGPNSLTCVSWTVDESCLSSSTQKVIQEDGASATSKVGIGVCYCTCGLIT